MKPCALELDGCLGTGGVARFHVRRFGQRGFAECCSSCWATLVGQERHYEPEVKKNLPALPRVPRRGDPVSEALPLYAPAPPKLPGDDWL